MMKLRINRLWGAWLARSAGRRCCGLRLDLLFGFRNPCGAWPGLCRRGGADENHGCQHHDA
ncbi:MAG: hypothetical protein WBF03_06870 [Xanthobacteraceae bacterium]